MSTTLISTSMRSRLRPGLFPILLLVVSFFYIIGFLQNVHAQDAPDSDSVIPNLGIDIPGTTFSRIADTTDVRKIPFLMEYVNGVYRFAITLGMLASIIVIMWGGFLYLAGSTIGSVEKGKKKIVDALAGFAILLGATAILNTVNPMTAVLRPVEVPRVEAIDAEHIPADEMQGNASSQANQLSQAPQEGATRSTPEAPVAPTPIHEGAVTKVFFDYRPNTNSWLPNESVIIAPSRALTGGSDPIHIYIYIHGLNGGNAGQPAGSPCSPSKPPQRAAYIGLLTNELQAVAGSKNIIVLAPHSRGNNPACDGNYMSGFNLANFYSTALRALTANGVNIGAIRDIVVSGHSAATCYGHTLATAVSRPLPNQIGVVAYDGCIGQSALNGATFSPANMKILIDADGQARSSPGWGNPQKVSETYGQWGFTEHDPDNCPRVIQETGVTVQKCYTSTTHPNWLAVLTRYGHGASVGHITRLAFRYFYQ